MSHGKHNPARARELPGDDGDCPRYTEPMGSLVQQLPPELVGFLLALALGFLIGFEREESQAGSGVFFGGVRTFPIIALGGFLLVTVFPGSPIPFATGLL